MKSLPYTMRELDAMSREGMDKTERILVRRETYSFILYRA